MHPLRVAAMQGAIAPISNTLTDYLSYKNTLFIVEYVTTEISAYKLCLIDKLLHVYTLLHPLSTIAMPMCDRQNALRKY